MNNDQNMETPMRTIRVFPDHNFYGLAWDEHTGDDEITSGPYGDELADPDQVDSAFGALARRRLYGDESVTTDWNDRCITITALADNPLFDDCQ